MCQIRTRKKNTKAISLSNWFCFLFSYFDSCVWIQWLYFLSCMDSVFVQERNKHDLICLATKSCLLHAGGPTIISSIFSLSVVLVLHNSRPRRAKYELCKFFSKLFKSPSYVRFPHPHKSLVLLPSRPRLSVQLWAALPHGWTGNSCSLISGSHGSPRLPVWVNRKHFGSRVVVGVEITSVIITVVPAGAVIEEKKKTLVAKSLALWAKIFLSHWHESIKQMPHSRHVHILMFGSSFSPWPDEKSHPQNEERTLIAPDCFS